MRSRVAQAQTLIGELAYEEAIAFLDDALHQSDDTALRFLRDQAMEGRESLQKQVEAGLANAARLAKAGKHAEAIQFLEALPPAVRRSVRVLAAESALKDEQQQAIFRTIGRAYTALETDLPAGDYTIRRVAAASGNSAFAGSVAGAFRERMRAFADRAVAELTGKYKVMVRNGDKAGAGELARQVTGIVAFAGPQMKSGWESLVNQAGKTSTSGRLRK